MVGDAKITKQAEGFRVKRVQWQVKEAVAASRSQRVCWVHVSLEEPLRDPHPDPATNRPSIITT